MEVIIVTAFKTHRKCVRRDFPWRLCRGGSVAKKVPGDNPASYPGYDANSKAWGGTNRSHTSNIVPVSQWYGHPRVLGYPILKPLVIWVSPVILTLTLTQITKVIWKGDAHTTWVNGLGMGGGGWDAHITITPALLAGRAWGTKFQSSVGSKPHSYSYFRDGPHRLHKVWHKTYPVCDAPLSISGQRSFAPSQKSRCHNPSCEWTDALSSMIFVVAQNLSGIAWT